MKTVYIHSHNAILLLAAMSVCLAPVRLLAQEADQGLPPQIEEAASEEPKPAKTKKEKKDKQPSFDNSRTDINLYNQTVSDKDRVKSLFYTETEIKDVHLAVNTYLKNIGRGGDLTFDEAAFLTRLGALKNTVKNQSGQSRFFTYPQFFLNSLVYYAPDDWVIWINGEKITPETPRENSNIRVTGITPEKVTLEWFPLEMDRVLEIWKAFPNEAVTVDAGHKRVLFSVKQNQTFSSYTMTALEGKVLPVTVDVTKSVMPFKFDDKPEEVENEPTDAIQETDNIIQEEE